MLKVTYTNYKKKKKTYNIHFKIKKKKTNKTKKIKLVINKKNIYINT